MSEPIATYRGTDLADEDRDQRRRDVANWVAAAGVDPATVLEEFVLTDEGEASYLLHLRQVVRSPAGAVQVDPETGAALTRELHVPVDEGSWPDWLDVPTQLAAGPDVDDLGDPAEGTLAIGPKSAVPAEPGTAPAVEDPGTEVRRGRRGDNPG